MRVCTFHWTVFEVDETAYDELSMLCVYAITVCLLWFLKQVRCCCIDLYFLYFSSMQVFFFSLPFFYYNIFIIFFYFLSSFILLYVVQVFVVVILHMHAVLHKKYIVENPRKTVCCGIRLGVEETTKWNGLITIPKCL